MRSCFHTLYRSTGLALSLSLMAGCSMAPSYQPPKAEAPAQFKEIPPGWASATPMDGVDRGRWWSMYGDPVLDDLEARSDVASPTLAAALARYDQARATARIQGSALFPEVSAGGSGARTRVSEGRPLSNGSAETYNDYSVGASLDYELDLWGRIRNSVKSANAEAQASAADLALARLSLQASVADCYFRLRGLDAQAALLRETVEAFGRAYDLTATRHDGGIASGIDVNRSRTVLYEARAQLSAVANARSATEHELAALVGAAASDFAVDPVPTVAEAPALPAGTPSQLLERRPDIAAAERRVFGANARIGVARAAFFPTLTLGVDGGYRTTHGALLASPNSFWGLGPLSAVVTLFDGGRRNAQVRLSRAEYDEIAANYRETVLTAFRQTEDALAANRYLATQISDQRESASAAGRTRELALTRYHDGASDYLQVVLAQTDALAAERTLLDLRTQRLRASVSLIRAMGGAY